MPHRGLACRVPWMRDACNARVQALDRALMIVIIVVMATHENAFELRLGRIARERSSTLTRVRATVRQRAGVKSEPKTRLAPKTGIRAHFRMGSAGKARPVIPSQRRVVVKARYALHGSGKGAPLKAHVKYLARESKAVERSEPGLARSVDYLQGADTPGHGPFSFYDRSDVGVDGRAITAGWAEDRLHFRLIISPEDGAALGDLKPFIREVMAGLEGKLGTKLDWIALDHWDTDNPHTHILVRGKRSDGQDLFIPSRLISSGIREHAQEIVTRVLGPRLEADIARDRWREIGEARITQLDRQLLQAQVNASGPVTVHRPDLIARLERLERWGLAERGRDGWRVTDDLYGTLSAMEARQRVERAVSPHRRPGEVLPLLAADPGQGHAGELVHYGPMDKLGLSYLAVIETGSGELRYAQFSRADDLARLDGAAEGALVSFTPATRGVTPADHAIAAIAARTGGYYSADHHLAQTPGVDRSLVAANIRRLEAMRRMSLVSRDEDGVFRVGHDHLKRALMAGERLARRYPLTARVASYWTLEEQVKAIGPTRLDRVLAGELAVPEGEGAFARRYASAVQQRLTFLVEQGWIWDRTPSPAELAAMSQRERRAAADGLAQDLGKSVMTAPLNHVRGVYVQQIDL
ncbi:MAG: DUF3363 domain-containing protein, partial [Alphaproteobacteria bacterium]